MKLLPLFFFVLILLGCSNSQKKHRNLIDFIPGNTHIIIKTSNLESLNSSITNNDFLSRISKTNTYQEIEQKLKPLNYLKPNSELIICFSKDEQDNLQYTVITKFNKTLFNTDSLPNYKEETLNEKNKPIIKSTINKNIFYSTVIDSTFLASSSKNIINDAFTTLNNDVTIRKMFNTTAKDETLSVIIKPENHLEVPLFVEDSISLNNLTEYVALDVDLNQNHIYFNGITKATDTTTSLINIFKNTKPQINQIQNITPSNSDGFMSFTFNNFNIFYSNLSKFNDKDSISAPPVLFKDIIEIGVIYEDENRAIVLNAIDVITTKDALLSEQNTVDTYREIDIYTFSKPLLFSETLAPLVRFNNASKYCILDHYFVFANSQDMLQNIIASYQNKTTLSGATYFKEVQEKLSDASSLLQVINAPTLKNILDKNLNIKSSTSLKNYSTSAIQFIYDTNFAHINGIIKKDTKKKLLHSVTEAISVKLDQALLNAPEFVKNHTNNQKDIMVQDVKNNLYLISNTGKIQWKKQLESPILGSVEQIDLYKNGKLQFVFATKNKVYVLSKTGKMVTPFPLKFNDDITQPLSVFDYDNNKKYRLLVTQDKNTLMYDATGKAIRGFKFKLAKSPITSQPKHHKIGSKDYISIKTKDKLFILDRLGKIRVQPKKSFTYSNQPVFLYNNTFTTTTPEGDLVSIDQKGNVTSKNLNLSTNHYLETSNNTLIAQSDNKLIIKNRTTNLDFGEYSTPKLFYINNKIYVSTTDLQSNKVYLYDSQSELLPNFPVYGNSSIMLDNIDKDTNLEFVVKGEANEIILYKIN